MSEPKIKNMEEFAAVSGISRPTVSKYFHDPQSVRESTRARIEAALEKYDYKPNIYAVNQNRRLTKNIGILVPYLADPFFAEIARNLENLVIEAGFSPIMLSAHGDPRLEVAHLEALRQIKPAGLLFAPLGRLSDIGALETLTLEFPTVHFDSNIEGMGEAFIGHDNLQSTINIVKYLSETGQPPVLFEMRTPTNPNAIKRRNAYIQAMEQCNLTPEIFRAEGDGWQFEEIGFQEGKRAIREKSLASNTVLCSNDRLAIGFLAAAYDQGLRVGKGLGSALRVAGHDNHPFSRYTRPTLTTISQNYTAIAEKSVETLLGLIELGEDRVMTENRETTLFDGQLIIRESA